MMNRRLFIKSTATVGAALSLAPNLLGADAPKPAEVKLPPIVSPNKMSVEENIKVLTGGKAVKSGKITLTAPDIAENGAVVPVKVEVDHPMDDKNYVKAIHVINEKNQNSRCASVLLTPANGKGYFSTRVKLGESQKVIALAELSDGSFYRAEKEVKVTIGGCG
ncbi:MAG: thiosulfate oxidation carrier protein SoxY [Campylobacterales bacterium]